MTIASEIQRIQTNIANAYDALEAKGATMPATENTDNLVTTIDTISGGGGDIITATNNTGNQILVGDKVWVNKEPYYERNFTVVGNPTINDSTGVVSGFDANNYLQLQTDFNPGNNTWEWNLKVTTGDDFSYEPAICGFTADQKGVRINLSSTGNFVFLVADSSWINIAQTSYYIGTYVAQTNTTYYLKCGWTGTEYYFEYSLDGVTYTRDITAPVSTAISSILSIFGTTYANNTWFPWNGSIDLSETYINVNGVRWWTPTYTKLSDYMIENYSSFESSNLKINGTLNISNGIASGFGVSNFITVGNTNFDLVNHWSFETEITTGNDVSTYQMIFTENRADYNSGLQLSGGYFSFGLSNTHSSVNIGSVGDAITQVSANTTYKLKFEFTGTKYDLYVNDNLEGTLNSTAKLLSWIWNLGCANTNNPIYAGPFLGSINLNKTKITAGGFTWTPNIQNVTENTLMGYAQENIAISSTGDVLTLIQPQYYAYKDFLNRYVYCKNLITSTDFYYDLNARSDNGKATSISELTVPTRAKPVSVTSTSVTFNVMPYYRTEQDDLY